MRDVIEQAATQLDKIRTDLIFHPDNDDGALDALAQLELLQSLALLEAAHRGLSKAALLQARTVAAKFTDSNPKRRRK